MKQQAATRKKKQTATPLVNAILQRSAVRPTIKHSVPLSVYEALHSPGQSLDSETRAFMEPRFGHDFSRVRVHTDSKAAESARAVDAFAFTVGNDVVFGSGRYAPQREEGRELLTHELVHVVQQTSCGHGVNSTDTIELLDSHLDSELEVQAEQAGSNSRTGQCIATSSTPIGKVGCLQRRRIGTRFSHPRRSRSPYRRIEAEFDGREFIVRGDGAEISRASAQSGRPIAVRKTDIARCGGGQTDTYMNNPRYVGISDNGPIPEGQYRFSAAQIATFSGSERREMLFGGTYTDPFGRRMHGGDWGAGRVPLRVIRIAPSSVPGCGNTRRRGGFYLHGGIMPGSSGCIDIGNSGFSNLVNALRGYRGAVRVTVRYRHGAPYVGPIGRFLGGLTYPESENPGLLTRIGSAFGQLFTEPVRREKECSEGCEELPSYLRGLCRARCSGRFMR